MRSGLFAALFTFMLSLFGNGLRAATTIPFQFRDGMIWVNIAVRGRDQPLHFLLDSGAGASVLDLSTARRLGLPFRNRQTVLGVGGRSAAYRVDHFQGWVAATVIATTRLAVDLSEPGKRCHQHIDGLLGADFFQNRIVEINFGAQTLRLLQRGELNSVGGETQPLARHNDALCARISLDGNAPEWLRLDTGCNTALEWVVSAGRAKDFAAGSSALNSESSHEIQTNVQVGAFRIGAVKTGIHTAPMFANEQGLIGNGFLSRFVVTIDAAKQQWLLAQQR